MSDDELLKRLCSNSILGQMPHPSSNRKPFDVAMHITEEERQELIAQRSEAADLLEECERALDAALPWIDTYESAGYVAYVKTKAALAKLRPYHAAGSDTQASES